MAFIRYIKPFKGHLAETVPADKARTIQEAIDHPQTDITEMQREYLSNIKRIYHNTHSGDYKAPKYGQQINFDERYR